VIDECHNPLPTVGTPAAVVEWFKLHRHYNVDVLLMTQSFRDMCQPIARLMGVLVKVRKADILGKADHYIRKVHGGYRGAVISTEQRKYRPEMFPLYKSHTQGNGVAEVAASDVAPFIVKFKRLTSVWLVVGVAFAVWAFWPKGDKPVPAAKSKPPAVAEAQPKGVVASTPENAPKAVSEGPPVETVPEPYAGKGLHVSGVMRMGKRVLYAFVVSESGRRISEVSSDDLVQAGYRWEPMTDCVGVLRWQGSSKAVTCDAPMIPQGSREQPVVVAVPKGGGAPVASSVGGI